jgi:hypothetical protein
MPKHAKYDEYQYVKLKQDRPSISDHPITQLETPRPVSTDDIGIIEDVHSKQPVYIVEFFSQNLTVDLLWLLEDEIEPRKVGTDTHALYLGTWNRLWHSLIRRSSKKRKA